MGFTRHSGICQSFETLAKDHAEAPAIYEAGTGRVLNYGEASALANQLARRLSQAGIGAGAVVALRLERSIELIITVMAILKSGGAFLPLLPDTPPERTQFILAEANAQLLVVHGPTTDTFPIPVLNLADPDCYAFGPTDLDTTVDPSDLAYVMYTSGSSGRPKGVMIEHGALQNRLAWMQSFDPLGPGDVILQKTSVSFDVAVWELLWWAVSGASLCLMKPELHRFPLAIVSDIEAHNVTTLHFIPSMLSQFLKYVKETDSVGRLKSLKTVYSSGEALTASHVELFYSLFGNQVGPRLVNLYGPTEATIDVTFFECPKTPSLSEIPIGQPISNTEILILRDDGTVAGVDEEGEICIGGLGLARGYINNAIETARQFVPHPLQQNARIYKTGDLGRRRADGNVCYLGRRDTQVKIRGMRVELSEIEALLEKEPSIKVAAAVVVQKDTINASIHAFVLADPTFDPGAVKATLERSLPAHMLPTRLKTVAEMPKTPSGKIDRKALVSL